MGRFCETNPFLPFELPNGTSQRSLGYQTLTCVFRLFLRNEAKLVELVGIEPATS
jgi:hypothetical protein